MRPIVRASMRSTSSAQVLGQSCGQTEGTMSSGTRITSRRRDEGLGGDYNGEREPPRAPRTRTRCRGNGGGGTSSPSVPSRPRRWGSVQRNYLSPLLLIQEKYRNVVVAI